MSDKKTSRGFGGKGYYIALILCAAAIGISGYVYYRNANAPEDTLQNQEVIATDTVSAVRNQTEPTSEPTQTTEPAQTTAPTVGKMSTCAPLEGETVAEYAMECLSYNETTRDWRVHNGVDLAAEAGAPVGAAADGTVYTTYEDDTLGFTVVIRHDGGYTTRYSSLDENLCVSPGDVVTLGQTIGYAGDTALVESVMGSHVHFSVSYQDQDMDPAEFFAMS